LSARHGTPRPAGGTGDDFRAGIERAITRGWLWWHESSTYVKFTDADAARPCGCLTIVKIDEDQSRGRRAARAAEKLAKCLSHSVGAPGPGRLPDFAAVHESETVLVLDAGND